MEAKTEITCKCGSIIKEMEWYYSINDEGEDYTYFIANCDSCETEWELYEWGEYNAEEAQGILQDYIKEN